MGNSDTPVLFQSEQEWSNTEPSFAVVEAIAGLEKVEPEDLSTPLFDCIDSEVLDTLITDSTEIAISFLCENYCVQIDKNTLLISHE